MVLAYNINLEFAELEHALYDVNRAGRRKILIQRCGHPISSDRKIATTRRDNSSSRQYHGGNNNSNVDATVLLRMLETATHRNFGATFLLLRNLPNQYFGGSRRGSAETSKSKNAHRVDSTEEDDTGMWFFQVFTKCVAQPDWDRTDAAVALKTLDCADRKAFFYYASLHSKDYPHEQLDRVELTKYYKEYTTILDLQSKEATQSTTNERKRQRT